jgi:hypothetical protein
MFRTFSYPYCSNSERKHDLQGISSHLQSETRSKKKHKPAASISPTGPQETLTVEQVKKEKKKNKKQKQPKIQTDENKEAANETMQPEQDVGGENLGEKKKHRKRKHKRHTSSSDDSQTDTSRSAADEELPPKRQKTTAEGPIQVSQHYD